MWMILLFLFSFNSFGLEPFEKLQNIQLLRVLDKNIVMINRGLDDAILVNDHAKLSFSGGYAARAICVKAGRETSYWRLYRIPDVERISKDITYTLEGMADREIPNHMASLRSEVQKVDDPYENKKNEKPSSDPFDVKYDLPEKLTERDLIETVGPEKRKLFVEKALNKDQMKRDLQDFRVSVFASPFTRQSINEGESLRYGVRMGNLASKYRLQFQFEQAQSKMKDPFTDESVSTRSTQGQAQFVIHRLKPGLSSLSLINYNSTRFSQMATPKSHWQVGPIGFTWHIFENRTWEYFDLSYIPLLDMRTTDAWDEDTKTGNSVKETGLRHGFRLAIKTKINERVAFENLLWVRPFQDLASWEIQSKDLNLNNDLKLVFSLTEKLFFDYNFVYQYDTLWSELNGLPSSNIINSLNLRYDVDL